MTVPTSSVSVLAILPSKYSKLFDFVYLSCPSFEKVSQYVALADLVLIRLASEICLLLICIHFPLCVF